MTGKYSVYTLYEGHEIMFHVSTLLPFSRDNRQQVSVCAVCPTVLSYACGRPILYFSHLPIPATDYSANDAQSDIFGLRWMEIAQILLLNIFTFRRLVGEERLSQHIVRMFG